MIGQIGENGRNIRIWGVFFYIWMQVNVELNGLQMNKEAKHNRSQIVKYKTEGNGKIKKKEYDSLKRTWENKLRIKKIIFFIKSWSWKMN